MAVELRTVESDGGPGEILPDWSDLTFSQDYDPGALTFTYALLGANAQYLNHATELMVLLDGQEPADGRFFLNQSNGTNLDEQGGAQSRAYSCPSLRNLFDQLMIAPSLDSVVADPNAFAWTNRTPGWMLRTALDNALSRARQLITVGANITNDHPLFWLDVPFTSFSDTADSSGTPWPTTYDYTPAPGSKVSDLLGWMSTNGLAQVRMQGHTLQMFAPETFGVDRSADGPGQVALQTGNDFSDATYQTDSSGLINAVMVIGDDTANGPAIAWVYDRPSIAQFGYREGPLNVPGLSTQAMLKQAGNAYLSVMKTPRWSYTYSQSADYLEQRRVDGAPAPSDKRPFLDYRVGDTIAVNDAGRWLGADVRMLSATWPSAQKASVQLTINDWFASREEKFNQRLARLGG